jgi:hypothetical protein
MCLGCAASGGNYNEKLDEITKDQVNYDNGNYGE